MQRFAIKKSFSGRRPRTTPECGAAGLGQELCRPQVGSASLRWWGPCPPLCHWAKGKGIRVEDHVTIVSLGLRMWQWHCCNLFGGAMTKPRLDDTWPIYAVSNDKCGFLVCRRNLAKSGSSVTWQRMPAPLPPTWRTSWRARPSSSGKPST